MPMWRAVRMIRRAISPRLAIRSLRIRFHPGCRTFFEEGGKAFFSLRRGAARGDPSGAVGADRVVYGSARIVGDKGLRVAHGAGGGVQDERSEEHTSELQSLMRISYAVFCLKKKKKKIITIIKQIMTQM